MEYSVVKKQLKNGKEIFIVVAKNLKTLEVEEKSMFKYEEDARVYIADAIWLEVCC